MKEALVLGLSGERRKVRLASLLLVVLVAGVFWPVARHEFLLWDDENNVAYNGFLVQPGVSGLARLWRQPYEKLYVPVTYTTWWAIARVARTEAADALTPLVKPAPFHVANALLHIATVLVVFAILRRTARDTWAACAGAVLVAVHPVQVEPVAWVTGLKDVLSGLMCFVALWQYLRFVEHAGISVAAEAGAESRVAARVRRAALLGSTIAFVLALLAKPVAVVTPVLAGVLVLALHGLPDNWRIRVRIYGPLAAWSAVALVLIVVTRSAQTLRGLDVFVPVWLRPVVAGDAISFYLWKLFVPVRLGIDYGRIPARVIQEPWVWLTGLAPYALTVGMWVWRRRLARLVWTGWGLFVVGVLPVLGLIPFAYQRYSTVADRYVYTAMLGPALILAWAVGAARRRGRARAATVVCVALGVLWVARSAAQVRVWKDDLTLFSAAVAVNPLSSPSQNNLGLALSAVGNSEQAFERHCRAVELDPKNINAHTALGQWLEKQGRLDEAIAAYRAILESRPIHVGALSAIAGVHESAGRAQAAIATYEQALEIALHDVKQQDHAAEICFKLGVLYSGAGDRARAIGKYRRSLEFDPGAPETHYNLGNCLLDEGGLDAAIGEYRKAIELDPAYARAHYNVGNVLARKEEFAGAVAAYRRAVALEPDFADAHNNLGNALLKLGNAKQAITHYEAVLRIEPDNAVARRHLELAGTLLSTGQSRTGQGSL